MGRKRSNYVHTYFNFDREKNTSKCLKCEKTMKGNHATNLLRHFHSQHPEDYEQILSKMKSNQGVKEPKSAGSSESFQMLTYDVYKFIKEVHKRAPLWNSEPLDRDEKLSLWKEIGAAMFLDWHQLSKAEAYNRVIEIQRKWRSLRDSYKRELRSRRTGVRVNQRVYRHFKDLSFLGGDDGSVLSDEEAPDDNTSTNQEVTCEESSDHADPLQTIESKPKKHRKRPKRPSTNEESEPATEELECPVPQPVYLNSKSVENEVDSDKLFLLSFLPEMKQLPLHIKMWTRAQIANIMQEAVSSYYNNTTPAVQSVPFKRRRRDSSE